MTFRSVVFCFFLLTAVTFLAWYGMGPSRPNGNSHDIDHERYSSPAERKNGDNLIVRKAEFFSVTPPLSVLLSSNAGKTELPDNEVRRKEPTAGAQFEREERDAEGSKNEKNERQVKTIIPGAGAGFGKFHDPLLDGARSDAPQTMPTPAMTFLGNTFADNTANNIPGLVPPDSNGDVGGNYYVQAINVVISVYDKNTGARLQGPFLVGHLFNTYNNPCSRNDGDPVVLYDPLADRWLISQFSFPHGDYTPPYYQCIAISQSGDPTGSYYTYVFQMPNSNLNDYPRLGVWTDAYYMTDNQFIFGYRWGGAGLFAFDKAKMLRGDPTASYVYKDLYPLDTNASGIVPSDVDGISPPPDGLSHLFFEFRADEYGDPLDALRTYELRPDFANPANSTLTIRSDLPLAPFDARQPGGTTDIEQNGGNPVDSIADRMMYRVAYRNLGTSTNPINSYTGNFTVNVSGENPVSYQTYQAGIRWFELRRDQDALSVFDEGTHNLAPGDGLNGINNWMGSIAQDGSGDLALGFSQSGTGQKADIKIAGRTINQPNTHSLNEGEAVMFAAAGAQTSTSGRWGDYSSMSVDADDDCTFYYSQEYYPVTTARDFSTRIGKFKFPQCVASANRAHISGQVTNCETHQPIADVFIRANQSYFRATGQDGNYSILLEKGLYSLNFSKAGYLDTTRENVGVEAGQTSPVSVCLAGLPVMESVDAATTGESCGVGSLDPGETITVSLGVRNTGTASTQNLVATLLASGGATNTGTPQNYGAIAPNASAVREFSLVVNPRLTCGANLTLTWQLTDGNSQYGRIIKVFQTGKLPEEPIWRETFDGQSTLPAGWTEYHESETAKWSVSSTRPFAGANSLFAPVNAPQAYMQLTSPEIFIPSRRSMLKFKMWYNTNVQREGAYMLLRESGYPYFVTPLAFPGSSWISNPPNHTLYYGRLQYMVAWAGVSGGGTDPNYVDTVYQLPLLADRRNVQLLFTAGTDNGNADTNAGIRIDEIELYSGITCSRPCGNAVTPYTALDFDGDGRADVGVFRPSTGTWYTMRSSTGFAVNQFGMNGDLVTPSDFDGDGKADIGVFRPSDGNWYQFSSANNLVSINHWGQADDKPVSADYDGDGKADLAVYRPSNGVWYILNSSTGNFSFQAFGNSTDIPTVGDFNGDGRSDIAVYRPSEGNWYQINSADGSFSVRQFGVAEDIPVPADYDSDGVTDLAVFRPSTGTWYQINSGTQDLFATNFGSAGDIPAPADFDGDGRADIAVFRPSNGVWYVNQSQSGLTAMQFGMNGDKPIPAAFLR